MYHNSFLLGSGAERIASHLQAFSKNPGIEQGELQDCFYIIYDAEVASVISAYVTLLSKDCVDKFDVLRYGYIAVM